MVWRRNGHGKERKNREPAKEPDSIKTAQRRLEPPGCRERHLTASPRLVSMDDPKRGRGKRRCRREGMTRFEISGTRRRKREGGWVFVLRDGQVLPRVATTTATIMLPCRVFSFYLHTHAHVARSMHRHEEASRGNSTGERRGRERGSGRGKAGATSAAHQHVIVSSTPRTDGL